MPILCGCVMKLTGSIANIADHRLASAVVDPFSSRGLRLMCLRHRSETGKRPVPATGSWSQAAGSPLTVALSLCRGPIRGIAHDSQRADLRYLTFLETRA